MARITVPGFSGVVRITAPQRLEDHQAQVAVDSDFRSGDLRPYYGDADTSYTGPTSTPASMFLYDQDKLIAEPGDLSFTRSPVFFSDNRNNDKRVFYTNNTATTGDDLYPHVLESLASSGAMPSGNKRLGVPQPGTLSTPEFEAQSGKVIRLARGTISDSVVETNPLDDGVPKDTDALLLDVPGINVGSYTISTRSDASQVYTLRGSKMSSQSARLRITFKAGDADQNVDIFFKKSGHGLKTGDQVFLYHNSGSDKSAGIFNNLNSGPNWTNDATDSWCNRVYTVLEGETYDTFRLVWGEENTPLQRTSAATGDVDQLVQIGYLASEENALPLQPRTSTTDGSLTVYAEVGTGTASVKKITGVSFEYLIPTTADVVATWASADTADVVSDRSYVVTFVNTHGDESEPSNPTKAITVVPGNPVNFTGPVQPTDGPAPVLPNTSASATNPVTAFSPPTELRLYRTDATGTFRLVTTGVTNDDDTVRTITWAQLNTSGFTFVDTYPDAELGEPLATAGWSVPPSGLKGIVNAPNGVVAAYKDRTIVGSVPYAPYAWPIVNQVATDYDVVGLVPTSAGLVVVTKGMPSILIGDNPESWSMQKLEYPQGCVARRSIVDMGEFAMYASPDGLVAIAGANVEILTKSIMTREQWQAYNPSSIIAAQVEGRYIASYDSGSGRKGFLYDPQTQSFTDLGTTESSFAPTAFANDLLNDLLLMLNPDGSVVAWNQDTTTWKPYTWHSKWFQLPIPEIMGVAQIFTTTIDLTGRSLTFKLHGYDNNQVVLIYEISTASSPDAILGNRPFRLPYVAPGRFTAFKVTLEGSIPVGTVMVGRTIDELKEAP